LYFIIAFAMPPMPPLFTLILRHSFRFHYFIIIDDALMPPPLIDTAALLAIRRRFIS
jgi:hypothetical protein